MKTNDSCCVCLKEDPLIPLTNATFNSDTIYSKLQSVVPEVQWKNSFSICWKCLKILEVVVEFRNQCLKSSSLRLEAEQRTKGMKENHIDNEESSNYDENGDINEQDISVKIEEYEDLEKSTKFLCKICKIQFDSLELLYSHSKEVYKTGYTCSYCFQSVLKKSDSLNHKRNHETLNSKFESIEKDIFKEPEKNESENHEGSNKPWYKCEQCCNAFASEIQYKRHKKSHNSFICSHCNKSYKSEVMLAKHIKVLHKNEIVQCSHFGITSTNKKLLKEDYKRIHDSSENNFIKNNKIYKCNKCEKSYKTEKVMKNHFQTCDGIKHNSKLNMNRDYINNRCETCGKFYKTEKILKAHMKACRGSEVKVVEEEIKCHLCNITMISYQDKLNHVLNKHNVNLNAENICQFCYKQFSNQQEYKDHLVDVHSDDIFKKVKRSYSCEVCLKIFRYVKDVVEHCVKEHQMDSKLVKPFLCDKCDARFTSSANMKQHKQYHEGTRSYICSFCGKSYITKSDLTVHEYTHLNKRNYKCEFCDRAFNTNKHLRSHKLVVHTDSSLWKYHCNMCGKRFPLKSGYDQHILRHLGDKRFQCLICAKSFINSSELKKHMTFHSNFKAFKCTHCDKEYKVRRVYEIHLTKVHGIGNAKIPVRVKNFACHVCPSKFFDKQKLSRHLCTHTGIKPYACTMCEKKFSDKSYLKHHLKVAHNIVELSVDDMSDVKVLQVI